MSRSEVTMREMLLVDMYETEMDGLKAENMILREALEWIETHAMDREIETVASEALQRAGGSDDNHD